MTKTVWPRTWPLEISVEQRGQEDARMELRGTVDRDGADRVASIMRGLTDAGVRFVVVDLSGVRGRCPRLAELVDSVRRTLLARGGWLLPVGPLDEMPEHTVIDVFSAYQRARRDIAEAVDGQRRPEPAGPTPAG